MKQLRVNTPDLQQYQKHENLNDHLIMVCDIIALAWQAQPRVLIGLFLLQIIQGTAPIVNAIINKYIFDILGHYSIGITTSSVPRNLINWLIALALINLISQSLGVVNGYISSELTRQITTRVQVFVSEKINSLHGLAPFETPQFYDKIQLGTQGAMIAPTQVINIMIGLVTSSLTLIGFIGVLIAFHPALILLVLVAVLPRYFAQLMVGKQRYQLADQMNPVNRRAGYLGNLLSSIEYVKELRLFNLSDYFLSEYKDLLQRINGAQKNQQLKEVGYQIGANSIPAVMSSLALGGAILQALFGRISIGDVTLFVSAIGNTQSALNNMVYNIAKLSENCLFFSRYKNLLAIPQPIHLSKYAKAVPVLREGIELKNISFRYSEDHPWILRYLNLWIPSGKTIALVGLNGAGKSTLVKLLARFYDPTEGQILWDGIDITEFDPGDLRNHIGAVFQDFVHYDLSAETNIGLGNVNHLHNFHRIRRSARWSGIDQTIEKLPEGYQTILSRWLVPDGKIGVDLSGGEWQKVALARLFMRSSEFLILDEPTAALDAPSEYDLYSRFIGLVAGKTSLIISHRFSTVRIADMIAVLQGGKIIEYGSHEELVLLNGNYAELFKLQADHYRQVMPL